MRKSPLKNKKVLITSGPTWVAIDDVRVISNRSSGAMGIELSNAFLTKQAKVTLIEGPTHNLFYDKNLTKRKFHFLDEFQTLLDDELQKNYDVVVHAAAVSDYQVKNVKGKISSDKKKLVLHLTPTPKVINQIKKTNPTVFLVGFKLEPDFNATKAVKESQKLFKDAYCDLVVANSVEGKKYRGFIVNANKKVSGPFLSRRQIVAALVKIIEGAI